jgi:hypothetical protein
MNLVLEFYALMCRDLTTIRASMGTLPYTKNFYRSLIFNPRLQWRALDNNFTTKLKSLEMKMFMEAWVSQLLHCLHITYINVACAIGPSVNTLCVQLTFLFKPNFCNLFEFPTAKFTQKSISSTL